ncbi:DNA-binding response regulator [Pedobacter sp. L105]|uniref:response regulator transcription factor n=1 Tax=Pedobacter sp. L105 TaxID=1641871 RepID=UPI00131D8EF5|nr:DNA-binding response regulator [Pedobacter sp. L105]
MENEIYTGKPDYTKYELQQKPQHELSLLVINQDKHLMDFLKENLKMKYEVFTANNTNEGNAAVLEMIPDLIMISADFPEGEGFELTSRLKDGDKTGHIPIIMTAVDGNEKQQIKAMKNLADAFLRLPVHPMVLKESITSLLWNRRLLKNRYSSDLPLKKRSTSITRADKLFINEFTSYIERNLENEHLYVQDIAHDLGISRMQLFRKTKEIFNCSINNYILDRRLKKAKHLLANEDMSISQVTYSIGFSTPTYFSAVFKAKYNCTPTDFKKNICL